MRASIVGTTRAWVTRSRRAVSSHASGVNVSSTTARRPAYRFVIALATAAMWYGGRQTMAACSGSAEPNSTEPSTYDTRW